MAVALLCASCTFSFGPKITVKEERVLTIPVADVTDIQVTTSNGSVSSAPGTESAEEIVITATVEGGGATQESAEACLEAMEVTVLNDGGTLKIGWRFAVTERSDWQGSAAFEVAQPIALPFAATTSNGGVTVQNLTGACELESSNGRITVEGCSGALKGVTSNGRIEVNGSSGQLDFESSNGGITLDSTCSGPLSGRLETSNGTITVNLSEGTSADIHAETGNGSLNISGDYHQVNTTEDTLTARHGSEAVTGRLTLETSNGSITIGDLD